MEFKKVQLEMLHWEAGCNDDEAMLILMEKRGFHAMLKEIHKGKGAEVVDTNVHTLGLHIVPDIESASAKEPAN